MSVLKLADARRHLNLTATTHDGELQRHIDAAEAAIAKKCGPLTSTTVTDRIRGGGYGLVLRETPAISLTSVTPVDGDALTLSDLYLDTAAGVVTYESGSSFGARHYTVVYEAGRATVPHDLMAAVEELVRHTWMTQRGPTMRPGSRESESATNTLPGAGYLLPFRVQELIAPHIQPGFA